MTEGAAPPKPKRDLGALARGLAPWALAAAVAAAWVGTARPRPADAAGLSQEKLATPADFEAAEPGRGRLAHAPHAIPWRGWKDILWRTWRSINADRMIFVAGSITFFTLLAIFPALGAFVSIYGLIADVAAVNDQLAQLSLVFPAEVVRIVGEQMMRLATERSANLSVAFLVSLLLSIWTANAGMKALFDGLNIAYGETETRNFFYRTALTYAFTLAFLLFITLVSAILVAAPIALKTFGLRSGWMFGVRWLALFFVAAAAFSVAYRFGPCRRRARWRWVTWGAVVAAVLWMAGSAGFSWYVNNIAHLQVTYGSLGAAIGFMLWVWFSVLVVLTGAELNAEIEHQTAVDSTVGPPKPMGERGAVMADSVGLRFIGVRKGARLLWADVRRQGANLLRRDRAPPPLAKRGDGP
ncbi:YihY/virulence factor BrkB family protein [Phenylobacterium zucineum]|nr:YihY/virulence factor BrkB family protein [Phenylobacterium zucineum]